MKTVKLCAMVIWFGIPLALLLAQEPDPPVKALIDTKSYSSHETWLGVFITDITNTLKEKKGINTDHGACVSSVAPNSPADSIGLKEGDIIISFNGKTIDDADDLVRAVEKTKPGIKVSLGVMRNSEKKNYAVVLRSHKKFPEPIFGSFKFRTPKTMFSERNILGMTLSTLNKQLAGYFGAPDDKGVLIEKVEKESPAEKAGMKAGDVMTHIQDERIQNVADVVQALDGSASGKTITVTVIRRGEKKTFTLTLPEEFENSYFPPDFEHDFRFPQMKGFHLQLPRLEVLDRMDFDLQEKLKPAIEDLQRHLKNLELLEKNWEW
ncbi:MAG: PDZ domain-containing protein [Bacteroidota bacterium]|nr:PDZ domain-containing protein [Bacteroidota bacterium]